MDPQQVLWDSISFQPGTYLLSYTDRQTSEPQGSICLYLCSPQAHTAIIALTFETDWGVKYDPWELSYLSHVKNVTALMGFISIV